MDYQKNNNMAELEWHSEESLLLPQSNMPLKSNHAASIESSLTHTALF